MLDSEETASFVVTILWVKALALEDSDGDRGVWLTVDLVGIDLRAGIDALGEITGETVSDTLLETIFGRFCIGK